jgi:hypothetical protein
MAPVSHTLETSRLQADAKINLKPSFFFTGGRYLLNKKLIYLIRFSFSRAL